MKICPVGAELFHVDRQTGTHMTKLKVAFRDFTNAPNKAEVCLFVCFIHWCYKPFWLYFRSPVAGFSLLVFEVS